MKRFKNILVVFDSKSDNRALLEHVLNLAKRNHASLTVIDVIEASTSIPVKPFSQKKTADTQKPEFEIIEEFPAQTHLPPSPPFLVNDSKELTNQTKVATIDIWELIIKEEKHNLEQFVATIQHAGIQAKSKTVYGIPFITIIQEVLQNQHDLVMITADGRGDFKKILFGNTTMHLMRKCPCPVLVIKPDHPRQFRRILAAVDLIQDDEDRASLNDKILELATSLTRFGKCELLIVHAWRMYGESIIRGQREFLAEDVNMLLQETKEVHRQWLIKLLKKHPMEDLESKVYLLNGDAGFLITELAKAKKIDLIVMGTVSRTGIAGFLIGNTAEKVLHQVNCSILTIKPEGFVTPIKLDPV
jgi:nucleotide-binding universal stress UspA family protein